MRKGLTSQSKSGLSKQQLDTIKLIASGCTARYAALVLKIKHSAIKKWMTQDEEFKGALAEQLDKLRNGESLEPSEIKPKKMSAQIANPAKRPPG
jgi:hypothetical protein